MPSRRNIFTRQKPKAKGQSRQPPPLHHPPPPTTASLPPHCCSPRLPLPHTCRAATLAFADFERGLVSPACPCGAAGAQHLRVYCHTVTAPLPSPCLDTCHCPWQRRHSLTHAHSDCAAALALFAEHPDSRRLGCPAPLPTVHTVSTPNARHIACTATQ